MDKEIFKKQIEQEKTRHSKKMLELQKAQTEENERHQRNMAYIKSLKEQTGSNTDFKYKLLNEMLETWIDLFS